MEKNTKTQKELLLEIEALQAQLKKANDTLHAVCGGTADKADATGKQGDQIFALRNAEQTYRTLIEQMNDGAVIVSDKHTILFCNMRFSEFIKTPREKILGSNLFDYLSKSDRSTVNTLLASATSENPSAEILLTARDGSYILAHLSLSKIISGNSSVVCLVFTNLTERTKEFRHTKEQLRLAESKYRALVEHIPAITYMAALDDAAARLYISPQIVSILGFSPDEWLSDPESWVKQFHPEDRKRVLAEYKSSHEKGQPFRSEYRWLTRDGRTLWCYDDAVLVKDKTGKPIFFQGIVTDITEYKRATEEIYQLQSLSIAVSASGNLHDALVVAMQKICNYTGWIYGEAWMPNQDGTRLERDHAFYSSIEGLEKFSEYTCGFTFTHGSGLPGRAWAEKQPVWIKDVTLDPHYLRAAIAGEAGLKMGVGFPVIAEGEVVTVFVFYSLKEEERNDHLVKLILSMLSQIGSIIRRIQAEDRLRESEEKLRTILDNTTAVIYIKDMQGRYTFINKQFETLFHIKREEIKGKTPYDCFPKEVAAAHLENDRKVFEAKIPIQFDEKATHDDGVHLYISVKFPLFAPDGTVYAVCGISTDITERKNIEEALHMTEERLQYALDATAEGVWDWNIKTGVVHFSNQWIRSLGYLPEEVPDSVDFWKSIVHPDDMPRVMKTLQDHFDGRTMVYECENRLRMKSGEYRYNLDRGKVVERDAAGSPVRMVGTDTDITERKRAEDQLRKLSSAVEQSTTTIVITDTYGSIQYVNPKFTQLTGYTLEEAVGKNPRILKSGKTPPEVYKQLWDAITAGGEWQGEFCNVKKNGEFYWELAHISPLRNSEGAITNFIAFKDDITERKQIEAEQEKLREQLFRSQNLASVGKLAGGVAHNFNNLLTVIMGYASLLNMEIEGNSPFKDYTQKIIKTSQTAADLTQSLLAFSRKQPISTKPVNVNEIIKQSEFLLSKLIREDIALKTVLTREDTTVMADVGQIEQVLMNLATNARDAMPNGGNLTIHTDIMEMDDAFINLHGYGIMGKYVYIAVTDTGTGMDENTKLRVFEPFFTTKDVGKGTGLGLSSVYGIVKQHNGYITVDSEPGKGATFNIYLPVIESEAEQEEREDSKIHTPFPEVGTETLLLAEDDPEVREIVMTVFERAGYRVIEAVDGEDAIVKFMEHKDSIKLLVSDLIMPKKNGKEVYEAIRKVAPDMKVLFITGYDDNVIGKIDIRKGKFDYIIKPVSPVELLEKVREVLDKS